MASDGVKSTTRVRLAAVLPNIIAKSLSVAGQGAEFDAQMLDIELSLRRALATGYTEPMVFTGAASASGSKFATPWQGVERLALGSASHPAPPKGKGPGAL